PSSARAKSRPRGRTRRGVAIAMSVLVVGGIALFLVRARGPTPAPSRQNDDAPAPAPQMPSPPAGTTPRTESAGAPARLVLDFEHSLRSVTLRVWIDAELVLEKQLDSRVTKELAGLKL